MYLPDTEEAKHVIDAEGIEVLGHLQQALTPPQEAVLSHLVPVVCWEAPVLTVGREPIWWRTSLWIASANVL